MLCRRPYEAGRHNHMERICCIFGAGAYGGDECALLPSGAYVIAADAGYNRLRDFGVRPDLAVGDFDSMGAPPDDVPVVRHPAEKDDTDMLLAVREGFARGFSRFCLFGGTGGRIDHTLANLQTLAFIAERGGVGFLFGDDWTAAAVKNGTLGFPAGLSGTVSVFALGSPARGVYLTGLYYPLHDATLTPAWPLGVSNAFTGAPAAVTVKDGVLTVLWNGRTLPSAAVERPLVIE